MTADYGHQLEIYARRARGEIGYARGQDHATGAPQKAEANLDTGRLGAVGDRYSGPDLYGESVDTVGSDRSHHRRSWSLRLGWWTWVAAFGLSSAVLTFVLERG